MGLVAQVARHRPLHRQRLHPGRRAGQTPGRLRELADATGGQGGGHWVGLWAGRAAVRRLQ